MTNKTILTQPTAEEVAIEEMIAAFHEGAAPISPEAYELLLEYRAAGRAMKPYKEIQKAAQALIEAEMLKKGVNKLTKDGVVEVEEITTHRTKTDTKGIVAAYPEVLGVYVTEETGTRFDAKK